MLKITDKYEGTVHEINEEQIVVFLENELEIEKANELSIEEIEDQLHYQGYSLERI